MPPSGLRLFPPTTLAKYAHLSPADSFIWTRFMLSNPLQFTATAYDVRVGNGSLTNPDFSDPFQKGFVDLTQKRIDAVGFTAKATYVIEVKPRASVTALGQAIIYRDMYVRTYNPTEQIIAAIVTDNPDPDIFALAKDWDVNILTA
jgi:hypothetical protein